ncbi:9601_t:CDS:1, partial [Funneliformis geosporum]
KIYNELQLTELSEANRIYSYKMDFSQKFKYSLCFTCHNLMTRLKKSLTTKTIPANLPKTYRSNTKSNQ